MIDFVRGLFTGEQDVQVPLNHGTVHGRFVRDVVVWARETGGLRTDVLPEHALPLVGGVGHFRGHLQTRDDWAGRAYVSFASLCFGLLALMTAEGRDWSWLAWLGYAALGVFAVAAYLAYVGWRKARTPVEVWVFPGERRIGARTLRRLVGARRYRDEDQAWLFARSGMTTAAREFAATVGLRCFAQGPNGFTVVAAESSHPHPTRPLAA